MSNTQLFIPEKIKVGYQERSGTYHGKLAYVIYYDNKGVLRKETSWKSWCHEKLGSNDFENVPMEGFVLNKKAGGYSTGWNHRQTYCRVWDPRGFEIEIDIPNLLFILQETSCTKGKGLEGEFVYAWDGKDLVLLPAHCEEYKQSQNFTKLQEGKVSTKDLTPGCIYVTKKQEELVYLGKFNWFENSWRSDNTINVVEPSHVFMSIKEDKYRNFQQFNSLSNFAQKKTNEPVTDLADRIEQFAKSKNSGLIKEIKLGSQLTNLIKGNTYYYKNHEEKGYYLQEEDGGYRSYILTLSLQNKGYNYGRYGRDYEINHVTIKSREVIYLKDGILIHKKKPIVDDKKYTVKEILSLGLRELDIVYIQEGKEKEKVLI